MALYEFEGKRPKIGAGTFIHPAATIIGGVTIGTGCFIGPGATLRGDWCDIEVGDGSNVQDNCVVHGRPGDKIILGPSSHVGHASILHGVKLGVHVLVGMNAVLLDGVEVGDDAVIAAGAVVPPGTNIPARKMAMGVPAAITGDVSAKLSEIWWGGTRLYQTLPGRYAKTGKRVSVKECQRSGQE